MKSIINSDRSPSPVGPYNQAVRHGDTIYVSGQIAINKETGKIVDGTIEEEAHQVLKNIGYILEECGCTFDNVLKCSVFVTDMKLYSRVNEVYAEYFSEDNAPARELIEVANLPKYVNIEISCIAGV